MDWWVIPEGFLGKFVNALSPQGPTLNLYTTKQSAAKPTGAVEGPYASQSAAQAEAAKLNAGAVATPQNIAGAASSGIASTLTGSVLAPLFQGNIWIRVGEVVLGIVLLAVGVAKLTNAVPLATKIASAVK